MMPKDMSGNARRSRVETVLSTEWLAETAREAVNLLRRQRGLTPIPPNAALLARAHDAVVDGIRDEIDHREIRAKTEANRRASIIARLARLEDEIREAEQRLTDGTLTDFDEVDDGLQLNYAEHHGLLREIAFAGQWGVLIEGNEVPKYYRYKKTTNAAEVRLFTKRNDPGSAAP